LSFDHFKFLETLGLSGADVRTAAYHAAAYQSVMRTSIREPSNRERKTIVVPDRPLAEYLQQRFPGSRIHILDAGIVEDAKTRRTGRPRKYQSNRDRMAEQRARRAAAPVIISRITCNKTVGRFPTWITTVADDEAVLA
jgi:hypothetical protein